MKKQNLDRRYIDNPRAFFTGRADGDTESTEGGSENENTNEQMLLGAQFLGELIGGNNRRRAGIRINNVFFSIESFLLFGILVCGVVALCRKK